MHRLFGTTTASSTSMPTSSQQYTSNGSRSGGGGGGERGRRSPASSPPSMTHQLYRERDRSVPNIHELSTRTVSMSRDQLLEGGQGFGICVKGGRDAGELSIAPIVPIASIRIEFTTAAVVQQLVNQLNWYWDIIRNHQNVFSSVRVLLCKTENRI